MRAQTGEICTPKALIRVPYTVQYLEGDNFTLDIRFADGIGYGDISSGKVGVGERERSFSWSSYGAYRKVTLDSYSREEPVVINDGDELALTLSGIYQDQVFAPGNSLLLQVFHQGKDFDGDGLNNEVETGQSGLDPARSDTDGDGVDDGADDLDGDGLSNADELFWETGINNPDSDQDGLSDGDEVNLHGTQPLVGDTDNDGISDGDEINGDMPSNPTLRDSDGDGIDDSTELEYGLDPSSADDASLDNDEDGLSNLQESVLGTDLNNAHSDDDGINDGDEVNGTPATDPLNNDTDDDGLLDNEDYAPIDPDTQAPQVVIESPDMSRTFLKGQPLTLDVSASDAGRITEVRLLVNGIEQPGPLQEAPYQFDLIAPTGSDTLQLEVQGEDTNGNVGSTGSYTLTLVDDPMTTVVGALLDDEGNPVSGAEVTAQSIQAESNSDGSFFFVDVPVARGDITVTVNAEINGTRYIGQSETTVPVWGGSTDVGEIVLRPDSVRVGYYHAANDYNYDTAADYQAGIIVAADMKPVEINDLAAFDLSLIHI